MYVYECNVGTSCLSPSLTWRDIQHLIVQTSKRYKIEDGFEKQSWQINGAGYHGTMY